MFEKNLSCFENDITIKSWKIFLFGEFPTSYSKIRWKMTKEAYNLVNLRSTLLIEAHRN